MTNIQKTIIITGVTIFLLIVLPLLFIPQGDCGQEKEVDSKEEINQHLNNTYETTEDSIKVLEPESFIEEEASKMTWEEMEKQFINSCSSRRVSNDYCRCGFGVLKDRYTKVEYIQIAIEMAQTGEMPRVVIVDMLDDCNKYLIN